MSDFHTLLAVSAVSLCLVGASIAVTALRSRRRGADEPTGAYPEIFIDADDEQIADWAEEVLTDAGFDVLRPDPLDAHFDEAARLLRGDTDADFAAIYDRQRLQPYEAELQTARIRRLTRRLERLQN
jgi:hypothetical protein